MQLLIVHDDAEVGEQLAGWWPTTPSTPATAPAKVEERTFAEAPPKKRGFFAALRLAANRH